MLTDKDRPTAPRKKEDLRLPAVEELKRTLSARVPGQEQDWARQVGDALERLETALRASWGSGKTSDSPLASVDKTRPTLAREAEGLHCDHDRLVEKAHRLGEQARQLAKPPLSGADVSAPDFGATQQRIEQFLAELGKNLEDEAVLVLDSANTDIGVGD